jgi:glycosyltransferase involved in cell wall biosynthesis
MTEPPLVSCILATNGRRNFLRQSLRCFLAQTYPNKELVVVDDSRRSAEGLCRDLPGVRYIYLPKLMRLGSKLNLGIEAGRGDILHKVDDDDFYSSEFLATSVASLSPMDDRTIVCRCCFLVLLAGDPVIRYSGHGWKAGGTLCFHRLLWKRIPFRDVRSRVDHWFFHDHDPNIVRICRPEQYILVRHGGNTWNRVGDGEVDDYFRRLDRCGKRLEEIVALRDLRFYRRLVSC